jgi:hypothetical protein
LSRENFKRSENTKWNFLRQKPEALYNNETRASETKCAEVAGRIIPQSREVNATSSELQHIHPPAGAGKFAELKNGVWNITRSDHTAPLISFLQRRGVSELRNKKIAVLYLNLW